MDVPAPPAIVVEKPAPCADATRAEELLQRTLAPAVAPRASWTVTARFERKGNSLLVEGEITDESDAPVAHRVLTDTGTGCSSLARALGVWASLVLDSEVERASHAAPPPEPPPPPPRPPSPPAEKPTLEAMLAPPQPEGRTLELGLTMSIMGGMGSGVMGGPTLYGVIETGKGWFLRPAVFVERTLQEVADTSDVYGTLLATRVDLCGRISGFHIKRIQLDICGGAELGFMHFDAPSLPEGVSEAQSTASTIPFFALGPGLSLRGELGGGLALVLGGVGNFNVVREGFSETFSGAAATLTVDPSPFLGRAELGLSWQLR